MEDLNRDYDRESAFGEPARTTPGPYSFRHRRAKKQSSTIIYVGIAVIIVGLLVAAIPFTWRSMDDIANDWEGTSGQGYYKSYNEGSTVTVSGKVTGEYPITLQNNSGLYAMGYRYCYELDNVWDECPISKKDYADLDDEVNLNLKLEVMNVGGGEYWTWTVTSKADKASIYTASLIIIIIGVVVVVVGAMKRAASRPKVDIPSTTYSTTPKIRVSSPKSPPTSLLENKKYCTHCGAEMPIIDIKCPECGKSKFDA